MYSQGSVFSQTKARLYLDGLYKKKVKKKNLEEFFINSPTYEKTKKSSGLKRFEVNITTLNLYSHIQLKI